MRLFDKADRLCHPRFGEFHNPCNVIPDLSVVCVQICQVVHFCYNVQDYMNVWEHLILFWTMHRELS